MRDVVSHCSNKVTIDFPIIADESRDIAVKYGMIDPELKDKVNSILSSLLTDTDPLESDMTT